MRTCTPGQLILRIMLHGSRSALRPNEWFLESTPNGVLFIYALGHILMHWGIYLDWDSLVTFSLKCGCLRAQDGYTALMSASLHVNTGTIKALLAVKADTEAKGSIVSDV